MSVTEPAEEGQTYNFPDLVRKLNEVCRERDRAIADLNRAERQLQAVANIRAMARSLGCTCRGCTELTGMTP